LVSHLQPIFYHNFCDESYSVASMVHVVSEPSPGWKYNYWSALCTLIMQAYF